VLSDDLSWVSPELGVELARYAKMRVASTLGERVDTTQIAGVSRSVHGAFVTIMLGHELRGCMGYVGHPQPLLDAVGKAALAAAFEDPRFPPLTRRELGQCSFEVTLLGPLREIVVREPSEVDSKVRIGVDGVLVRGHGLSGLLLPQVALQYGWAAAEFVSQACLKAGLPADSWMKRGTRVYLFEGRWFSESK
jgi:AmmeMemoRadiSam system protein A